MQKLLVALGVVAFLFVLPMSASAAGLVPCGGATERPCQTCDVVVLTNNVVSWLVMILGTIAAILIVVAGVRLVTSGGNTGAMEEAKSSMTNLIIGYLIVLSAWLVLDYGLKALLIQDGTKSFGVWNEVSCVEQPLAEFRDFTQDPVQYIPLNPQITNLPGWVSAVNTPGGSGNVAGSFNIACRVLPGPPGAQAYDCSAQQAQCRTAGGGPVVNQGGSVVLCNPVQISGGSTGGTLPQCTNQYCSVSALMAAGMTQREANIMSCIAITESSGNPFTPPYNQTHPGSNSSACGLFQVVRTTWNAYNPGGSCINHAASCQNAVCNTRVAVKLVKSNGFNDWLCPNCNPKAKGCVDKYKNI
jgi:uncharacterized membrane protein YhdT